MVALLLRLRMESPGGIFETLRGRLAGFGVLNHFSTF